MPSIEVFADVSCPFAYVGLRAFAARRRELATTEPLLRVRAWPLELVNGDPVTGEHLAPEIEALQASVAPHLFAGFDPDRFPTTTLPALAASAAAARHSPEAGDAFALAVREALWEEGRDISDQAVLDELTARVGVSRATDDDRAAVDADLAEGRQRGVVGSPHWFTPDGDFFCPSLDIHKDESGFDVRFDRAGFERFIDAAFT